jgi:hypothetical protein
LSFAAGFLPITLLAANDSHMLGRLRQALHKETWQETLQRLTKELVPVGGEADTLQGELVRCIGNLGDEAHRNGWTNWDVGDVEAIDVLRRYLSDRAVFSAEICQQIQKALDTVRKAGEKSADEGVFGYEQLKFLAQRVAEWCQHHSDLIHKSPEATWLDDDPFKAP